MINTSDLIGSFKGLGKGLEMIILRVKYCMIIIRIISSEYIYQSPEIDVPYNAFSAISIGDYWYYIIYISK